MNNFTASDMDKVVEEFYVRSVLLLKSKETDYAQDGDRLKNFREVAASTGVSMEQVCMIYMHKHLQALGNMATSRNYIWDWTKPDGSEGAKQRVADAINYLFLLAAIMESKQYVD